MRSFGELLAYPLRSGITVSAASRGTGIKMLNMGELFRYPRIPSVDMARVQVESGDELRTLLEPGDLMFARRSLTWDGAGKCSIVLEVDEPTTWESSIIRARLDRQVALPEYYFYYFRSPLGRRKMETIIEQVAAAGIRLSELRNLRVPVPKLATQRGIAELLGALDDKIAANDRIASLANELLSRVFARMAASASLGHLADIAALNVTTTRPKSGGQLRYLDISAISDGSYEMPSPTSWDEAPGRARRVVRVGDTIWSTVRPNRRSHALVLDEFEEFIGSTGLAVISPAAGRVAGVYESAQTDRFVQYLESVAEGSAYPAVRAERFLEAPVPKLASERWDEFEAVALPMRQRIAAAMRENRKLATTRDGLLPLLISGQIKLRDAEKVLEEVV
jgi:type I restriction enzyme S subunit